MSRGDRDPLAGLERWAAQRAPQLVARAEQEAVAVLREALLAAAGLDDVTADAPSPPAAGSPAAPDRRRAGPRQQRVAPEAAPAAQRPDLLWAYCVVHDSEPTADGTVGIAGRSVERITAHGLAALVSHVPAAEFAAEPLTRNLNDLGWLERVARAHEAVLDAALARTTIVPLRMCTIFESEHGVAEMLERRRRSLSDALSTLAGRLEWAVKVLVDRDRVFDAARPPDARTGETSSAGEGGAYLQRRRDERGAREAARRLATDTADQIHARLQDWAIDARTRPPQNRELSGHEGEMVLNAAYLIERERTDELRAIVAELEEHHRGLGARIELTGPWPPYNFVPADEMPASA